MHSSEKKSSQNPSCLVTDEISTYRAWQRLLSWSEQGDSAAFKILWKVNSDNNNDNY